MTAIFLPVEPPKVRTGSNTKHHKNKPIDIITEDIKFPPKPPSKELLQKIIHGFSSSQNPVLLEESGCAVCGIL
ncbi:hypothetical protein GLOTRDRAFT_50503, partial [Gloeophyllum trabeum ATCC 11539]